MTDEARRGWLMAGPAERWRQSSLGRIFRGAPHVPPVDRWEDVLRAERSAAFRLAETAAERPLLRRLLRLPAHEAASGTTLQAREARVAAVRRSRLGRFVPGAGHAPLSSGYGRQPDRPIGFPRIGPALDAEIDSAIELLRTLPFEELQQRGWHFQPNHFHWPLNDLRFLRAHPEVWIRSQLPGDIEWDIDGQVELLERLAAYAGELGDVPELPTGRPGEFAWSNGTFSRSDACAYYGLIRDLRPGRVVEVGAGWSSLLLARAVAANEKGCEVTLIEPQRKPELFGELPADWTFVENVVQLADLAPFEALEAGDVLFYDGSHCVSTGSDVNWIFFEVLPRLAAGVWIHVHDMVWPWDYPPRWVLDEGLSWNEQYLVQAFLMGNSSYRVRLAMYLLRTLRQPEVEALLPGDVSAGSLWIEKLAGPSPPRSV